MLPCVGCPHRPRPVHGHDPGGPGASRRRASTSRPSTRPATRTCSPAATSRRTPVAIDPASSARGRRATSNGLPRPAGLRAPRRSAAQARFFQPDNGARIDAVRDAIEARVRRLSPLYPLLLTSLIEAADRVDSTTGVQMAYVKQWAPRSFNRSSCGSRSSWPAPGAPSAATPCALAGPLGHFDLAYLDPPYNQHRYFTNYHVWETLVAWDAPEHYGVACKRIDARDPTTPRSVFNSKRTMPAALARWCGVDCELLVLSYNDESWLTLDELEAMCAEAGSNSPSPRAVATLTFDSDALRRVPGSASSTPPGARSAGSATSPTRSCWSSPERRRSCATWSTPCARCRPLRPLRRRQPRPSPPQPPRPTTGAGRIGYNRQREQARSRGPRRPPGRPLGERDGQRRARLSHPRGLRPVASAVQGRGEQATGPGPAPPAPPAAHQRRPAQPRQARPARCASSSRAGTPPARVARSDGWSSRSTPATSTSRPSRRPRRDELPPPLPAGGSGPRCPAGAA